MPTKPAPQAGVKRALDREQLVLFYQPIHELESRRIVAAEALLRAQRESGEIRDAANIAAAAEEGPDLFRLDSWVVRQALSDAVRWQAAHPQVRISINLSPREFQEGNAVDRLRELLSGCGADPTRVSIEITETVTIEKIGKTLRAIEEIKSLGVEIWLDDFGTGHSSISHLQHFPLDGLKLPADFVKGVAHDKRCRAIVRAIIRLAHDLGMRVIAEGVEHDEQVAFLREQRCEYVQGFLYSRPMRVEEFEATLAAG